MEKVLGEGHTVWQTLNTNVWIFIFSPLFRWVPFSWKLDKTETKLAMWFTAPHLSLSLCVCVCVCMCVRHPSLLCCVTEPNFHYCIKLWWTGHGKSPDRVLILKSDANLASSMDRNPVQLWNYLEVYPWRLTFTVFQQSVLEDQSDIHDRRATSHSSLYAPLPEELTSMPLSSRSYYSTN